MVDVTEIIFDLQSKTHLWVSTKARKSINDYADGPFLMRLERYCKNGFENYDRGKKSPIQFEWDGVYRLRCDNGLFRLVGFYEDGTSKNHFICLDTFEKSGQGLTRRERDRIDEVARIKKQNLWRKCFR